MAQQILHKRASTAAKVPLVTDLALGELAVNTVDGKLFLKKNNGSDAIVEVGAHAFTGDATGSGNGSIALTLAASGVTAGTFNKVTVDAKGRVTAGANLTTTEVNSIIGYTPENVSNKNAVNGYAGLGADGKLPSNLLPALAITDTFVVASDAAMLATGAQRGDVTVRTDLSKSFILKADDPTVLGNWQEILGPVGASNVYSVNSKTGTVTLTTSDITEGTNLYYTDARVRSAQLTGLVTTDNSSITATDTFLYAMGRLQAQINNRATSGANSNITSLTGLTTALSISQGGTGGTTAAAAKLNLVLSNVENKSSADIRSEITSANVTTALNFVPPIRGLFTDGAGYSLRAQDNRAVTNPSAQIGFGNGMRLRFGSMNDDSAAPYGDIIDLSTYTDGSGGGVNSLYFDKSLQRIVHKFAAAPSNVMATAWTVKTLAYTSSPVFTGGLTVSTGNLSVSAGNISLLQPAATQSTLTLQSGAQYAQLYYRDTDKNYGLWINDGTTQATRLRMVGPTGNMNLIESGLGNLTVGTYTDDGSGSRLQVTGGARFTGQRPMTLEVTNGALNIKGDTGGWATGVKFQGSSGTQYGGFWGWGGGDTMTAYSIGDSYDSGWLTITRNGRTMFGTYNDDNSGARLQVNGSAFAKGVSITVGDNGRVLETRNSTAAGAAQFYIDHSLGNVNIGNSRGALNLLGNATSATTSQLIAVRDNTSVRSAADWPPNGSSAQTVRWDFVTAATTGQGSASNYSAVETIVPFNGTTSSTGGPSHQVAYGNEFGDANGRPLIHVRSGIDTTWKSWWSAMLVGGKGTTGQDLNNHLYGGVYRVENATVNLPPGGADYGNLLVMRAPGYDTITQIYGDYGSGGLFVRGGNPPTTGGGGSWSAWKKILDSSNYNNYSPTLTGTGASGTWNISISGTSSYLGSGYISGGQQKPNSGIFGAGLIRGQMLWGSASGPSPGNINGAPANWMDTLWISTYTGTDVKLSTAIISSKGSDWIGFSKQNYDAADWGTVREFLHSGNIGSYGSQIGSTVQVVGGDGTNGKVLFGSDSTNGGIEVGAQGRSTAGTPFIDFHSSAGSPDFDVRLIASGGNNVSGNGFLTVNAQEVGLPRIRARQIVETKMALAASTAKNASNQITLDLANNGGFKLTMDSSPVILLFSAPPTGSDFFGFTLMVVNDATANRSLTFPTCKWSNGQMPARTLTANAIDWWYFETDDGGATWHGTLSSQDSK